MGMGGDVGVPIGLAGRDLGVEAIKVFKDRAQFANGRAATGCSWGRDYAKIAEPVRECFMSSGGVTA